MCDCDYLFPTIVTCSPSIEKRGRATIIKEIEEQIRTNICMYEPNINCESIIEDFFC